MTLRRPVIAVDAAGGDRAPVAVVEGAMRAAAVHDVDVLLVGPVSVLPMGDLPPGVSVLPSGGAVRMADEPVKQLRRQPDASVAVACGAVAAGLADAVLSAGSTGATVAAARLRMGRLPGVRRPAIAAVLPGKRGIHTVVLVDIGANEEVRAPALVEFARFGTILARARLDHVAREHRDPVVGLLNVGTEPHKGNSVVREAHRLLERSGLPFVGNVEGWELLTGRSDVVVCDGFTGNIALKVAEGTARVVLSVTGASWEQAHGDGETARSGPAADLAAPEAVGGSLLLGVDGVCVVAHGSSDDVAVESACGQAAWAVREGIVEVVRAEFEPHGPLRRRSRRRAAHDALDQVLHHEEEVSGAR